MGTGRAGNIKKLLLPHFFLHCTAVIAGDDIMGVFFAGKEMAAMDIRKPFLKSFTVKELKQFTDHYMKHRKMLHVSEHFWKLCVLVVRLRAKSVHM